MLDLAKIRHFYFNPPPDDPEREPSREELWARAEREAVDACLRHEGDPKAEGLGEHGSLIGGPDKPLRRLENPERRLPRPPLPLAWFDNPHARTRRPPSRDPDQPPDLFFDHLSAAHLAGYPNRPNGAALRRLFRSAELSAVERDQLWHVLACIRDHDLGHLLGWGELSVYETARAIHLCGADFAEVVIWINQFATRPRSSAGAAPNPRREP